MNASRMLSEVASYGPFFTVTAGGADSGWRSVHRCYRDGCTDLIDMTVRRLGTADLRIGASLVQFGHAARLWSPVLACALDRGVLLDLDGLQRADDGSQLRLPVPVADSIDPSRPLAGELYRVVVQDHLEPLAAGLRVKMASGLLYGNAASALVGSARELVSARPDLREPAVAVTEELLATGRLAGSGLLGGLEFRRRSCCLYYRVPAGAPCGDCALSDPRR